LQGDCVEKRDLLTGFSKRYFESMVPCNKAIW
jgi:hypothetical protein